MSSREPLPQHVERRIWMVALFVLALVVAVATVFGFGPSGSGSHRPEGRTAPSSPGPRLEAVPRVTPIEPASPRMARSVPTRLQIPAIRVDSTLMGLGLKDDGTMETPPGPFPAGWFTGAPTPGETGPAIIVGHVRYESPGVFERLTDLRRNDAVNVRRKDGSTARFRVTRVDHFAKSAFPSKLVYGNIDHAGLRLITCGGLDSDTNKFDENVVVFADLLPDDVMAG